MKDQISIIVPIYNTEAFLNRCIDSILCQHYSNFELLLIDDGSTDNSLSVCRKYTDSRVHVFTKQNTGLGDTRNFGIEHIHNDSRFICFCDSDDSLEPEFLSKLVNCIGNSEMSICNVMNRWGEETYWHNNTTGSDATWYMPKSNEEFLSLLPMGIMNSACNKLYRTEIITKNNLRFKKVRRIEDGFFNFDYLNHCISIQYIDLPLYNYWHRPYSLTTDYKDDSIQEYLNLHTDLLFSFESKYHKYVHRFLYPQYFDIQRDLILNGKFNRYKINRKEMLCRKSLKNFKPTCVGDWLHYITLWYFPHLYPALFKILNSKEGKESKSQ